jgi:very-short-patch-repair endonuclease
LPPGLSEHAREPKEASFYQNVADRAEVAIEEAESQIAHVMSNYDIAQGPWDSWENAKFEEIKVWSQALSQDADSASDWLLYRQALTDLDHVVGAGTTDLIRRHTEECELVPDIIERRILSTWLDWAYQDEPSLVQFASAEQDNLIANFKELDQQLPIAAQQEVFKRVLERYPDIYSSNVRTGELADLRGQLSRRRRQWSVRRLLRAIPRLIQTLKPCFFMSPLAVSQYLPRSDVASETFNFDVVIFDEASQVYPWDAVPAIIRADQTILAGDQKQLPPTSFWRRSSQDDDDLALDDDNDDVTDANRLNVTDANRFTGRESILDVAVGEIGRGVFVQEHLNVHYRSVDPNLIRFSNRHFYTPPGLLLFPSPGVKDPWTGVHDVYVPDGRYDPGEHRYNRIEAERVVELVFEHMRTRPFGESLGVVALSRAQSDLIDRLIERRRISERDVDERFDESSDEPFFVKNLENVQGDERDRMILSIGYGPTVATGVVPNRFGPINIEGGERRLNVVITRAKKRLDVVHSLRAIDIHAPNVGARLLRRFLEYAADPDRAFEAEMIVDPAAETESPFETAVWQALVSKGYKVERQVGVSGYRIDLAILSEDGTHRDLGIECDGRTYHDTPAARDRDWQRQQYLESLGWKIHRVWSTAWVRNPEAELARIENALLRVWDTPTAGDVVEPERQEPIETPDVEDHSRVEIIPTESAEIQLQRWVRAQLPNPARWAQLGVETTDKLVDMVVRIVDVEGPVHHDVVIDRIRHRYGLGSVKGSTRSHVEGAILTAARRKEVSSTESGDETFYWIGPDQLTREPRVPVDGNILHYPPSERKAIVLNTAKSMFGAERNDLVRESAKALGFERVGRRIVEILDRTIQEMLGDGELSESFGKIHPTR